MLNLTTDRIIVLDTETTGLDTAKDCVVEIAIKYGLAKGNDADVWRVRPSVPISDEAAGVHGIRNEDVADCPNFGEVADDIARKIEEAEVLVGYNPEFDIAILDRQFKEVGRPVKWPANIICAMRLWNIHIPPPKRHLQAAFIEFVSPEGFEGAHGAVADINATAEVLLAQIKRFDLEGKDWKDLDPERVKWVGPSNHFQWKDSYQDSIVVCFGKFDKSDLAEVDNGYLRYIIDKDFPSHLKAICLQMQKIHQQKIPNPSKAIAFWAKERYS